MAQLSAALKTKKKFFENTIKMTLTDLVIFDVLRPLFTLRAQRHVFALQLWLWLADVVQLVFKNKQTRQVIIRFNKQVQ